MAMYKNGGLGVTLLFREVCIVCCIIWNISCFRAFVLDSSNSSVFLSSSQSPSIYSQLFFDSFFLPSITLPLRLFLIFADEFYLLKLILGVTSYSCVWLILCLGVLEDAVRPMPPRAAFLRMRCIPCRLAYHCAFRVSAGRLSLGH